MITTEFADLFLTRVEMTKLEALCEKNQWAQLLWNICIPTNNPYRYEVGTLDAEEWATVVEDEAARNKCWFGGANGSLRTKVSQFANRVTSKQIYNRRTY